MVAQSVNSKIIFRLLAAGTVVVVSASAALAQEPKLKPQPVPEKTSARIQSPAPKPDTPNIEQLPANDAEFYCKNISDKAVEARIAWQTWKLVGLETKLKERADELAKAQEKLKTWVERREKLLDEVEDQVVAIIARMRPDSAAAQLATTDEDTAVGVLLKLKARAASEILDEMEPARAALLTQLMVGFSAPTLKRSF